MEHSLLTQLLTTHYVLSSPVTYRLLRAYTNDVYEVSAGQERFIFKVYGSGWRTEAAIRFEMDLLRHLHSKGARVACPITGNDGDDVQQIPVENGTRFAVLFEYAAGEKPQPPFTLPLYEAFGRAIAQMHALSDDFVSEHPRAKIDLDYLIDAPLAVALPHVAYADERAILQQCEMLITRRLKEIGLSELDWGAIHGDATLDNLHVTETGGIVLYDFDSGGMGWRASDLQGWSVFDPMFEAKGTAFRHGYSQVRPLHEREILAAPYLTLAWEIWGLQVELEQRILKQGTEATHRYLSAKVVEFAERLPLLP